MALRALHSGLPPLFQGDKVLIRLGKKEFHQWLQESQYLVSEIFEVEVLAPAYGQRRLNGQRRFNTQKRLQGEEMGSLSSHRYHLTQLWNEFVQVTRDYFKEKGFVETSTPSLVKCPGLEPTLEPMATTVSVGQSSKTLFLPTSPELHLKKLLSQGWSEIFEVRSCFRNGELSSSHQPEFTILEWYRAYDSLGSIADDLQGLMGVFAKRGFILGPSKGYIGEKKFQICSLAQLFLEHTGIKLTPWTPRSELVEYCESISQPVSPEDTWDDVFHLIFLTKIECHLGIAGPELIHNFPPSQAALAQINKEGWADRFEFYWRGFEIGNAFNELTDPVEQRRRMEKEVLLRKQRGQTEVPMDEEFIEALERGVPPCAGIAVGLERLFLACRKMESLGDLRLFPYSM